MTFRPILIAASAILVLTPAVAAGQNAPVACNEDARFSLIDFWVGDWNVFSEGQVVGHNRIEKILDGCAVMEHWTGGGGSEGKSLFYYEPAGGRWKQVWVTGRALTVGGVKEKSHIASYEDGGVRFMGRVVASNGDLILDRTTLTPLENGSVRQVIEISTDGGNAWRTTFDATYRPADDGPAD